MDTQPSGDYIPEVQEVPLTDGPNRDVLTSSEPIQVNELTPAQLFEIFTLEYTGDHRSLFEAAKNRGHDGNFVEANTYLEAAIRTRTNSNIEVLTRKLVGGESTTYSGLLGGLIETISTIPHAIQSR